MSTLDRVIFWAKELHYATNIDREEIAGILAEVVAEAKAEGHPPAVVDYYASY